MEETGLTLDGEPLLFNDAFRAVHDYYGHGKQGVGFRASGEENAFRAHSGMFSDDAARAIASETRGQNSWLNYGTFGDTNRTATIDNTVFADQKTGLLPNWAALQNTPRAEARRNDFFERIRSGDAGNMRGLTGAITPEGNLRLVHYTGKQIDRIDPASYGTGLSGRTRAERNRSFDEDFQNRSFYGVEGTDNPYRPELGLNTANKLETEIPIEQVYDLAGDPDNLKSKLPKNLSQQEELTKLEKLINQSGYSGYIVRSKDKGDVAAIFDPLDAKRVTKFKLAPETVIASGLLADQQGQQLSNYDQAKYMNQQMQIDNMMGNKNTDVYNYGDVLPIKRNKVTGDYSLSNTGLVEDVIRGLLDVGLSRKSGMVKPTSILDMF
jgi:hypothetical protein